MHRVYKSCCHRFSGNKLKPPNLSYKERAWKSVREDFRMLPQVIRMLDGTFHVQTIKKKVFFLDVKVKKCVENFFVAAFQIFF